MTVRVSRKVTAVAGLAAFSLVLAACGSDDGDDAAATGDAGGDDASAAASYPIDCAAYEGFGDLSGTTVTTYSSVRSPETEAYEESFVPFEECTGVDVVSEWSSEFEAQIIVRVQGGNAPDLALYPQPGRHLAAFRTRPARSLPVPDEALTVVEENFDPYWAELVTHGWRRSGLTELVELEVVRLVLPARVRRGGLRGPRDLGRDDRPLRPDRGRQPGRHHQAVVCRHRLRRCHRLAGDRLGRGRHAPRAGPGLLRPVGRPTRSRSTRRSRSRSGTRSARSCATPTTSTAASVTSRRSRRPRSRTAVCPSSTGTCYMHRQASFYAANWPEGTEIGEDADVFAFYFPANEGADGQAGSGRQRVLDIVRLPPGDHRLPRLPGQRRLRQRSRAGRCGGFVNANLEPRPGERQLADQQAGRRAVPGPDGGHPLRRC